MNTMTEHTYVMADFDGLMGRILEDHHPQFNARTQHTCFVRVGEQLRFDLRKGFPGTTTKAFSMRALVGEVLGFFRGYDHADQFEALGCRFWRKNADETPDWLASPYREGPGHLGRIYGVQWTRWRDQRVVAFEQMQAMLDRGYRQVLTDPRAGRVLVEREINQLENVLRTLRTNPSDRRMIVSAWNVAELDQMALPPCHMDYRFVAFPDTKELDLVMTIRSWDVFLGGPFNVAGTALILAIMARLSGFTPREIVIQATNAHLYDNHIEQTKLQLSRTPFAAPTLELDIDPVASDEDIEGVFARIEPSQIRLAGYQSHEAIPAEMAA